jgi:hypothetical protein
MCFWVGRTVGKNHASHFEPKVASTVQIGIPTTIKTRSFDVYDLALSSSSTITILFLSFL